MLYPPRPPFCANACNLELIFNPARAAGFVVNLEAHPAVQQQGPDDSTHASGPEFSCTVNTGAPCSCASISRSPPAGEEATNRTLQLRTRSAGPTSTSSIARPSTTLPAMTCSNSRPRRSSPEAKRRIQPLFSLRLSASRSMNFTKLNRKAAFTWDSAGASWENVGPGLRA